MYNIVLDEITTFDCTVDIQGASTSNSKVRLIVESGNYNLAFDGTINSDGKVKIPIAKLKNVLKEGAKGNISLEVVADDTLFIPWSSEYKTEISKKVEVSFDSKPKPVLEEKKVKVTVGGILEGITVVNLLATALIKEGITSKNLKDKSKILNKVLLEFKKDYKVDDKEFAQVLKDLPQALCDYKK